MIKNKNEWIIQIIRTFFHLKFVSIIKIFRRITVWYWFCVWILQFSTKNTSNATHSVILTIDDRCIKVSAVKLIVSKKKWVKWFHTLPTHLLQLEPNQLANIFYPKKKNKNTKCSKMKTKQQKIKIKNNDTINYHDIRRGHRKLSGKDWLLLTPQKQFSEKMKRQLLIY